MKPPPPFHGQDCLEAAPSGAVGRRCTEILEAEWQGLISRSWNSERPLVFAHVVLTKMLGVRRAREIRAQITRRMDLFERVLHTGLVGNAEAEGAAQEGIAASGGNGGGQSCGPELPQHCVVW